MLFEQNARFFLDLEPGSRDDRSHPGAAEANFSPQEIVHDSESEKNYEEVEKGNIGSESRCPQIARRVRIAGAGSNKKT